MSVSDPPSHAALASSSTTPRWGPELVQHDAAGEHHRAVYCTVEQDKITIFQFASDRL